MKRPSKIDFIIELLGNRKLDIRNKEKILSLAASEIKKLEGSIENNQIHLEIEKLKEKVNELSKSNTGINNTSIAPTNKRIESEDISTEELKPIILIPKPKETKSFLTLFNNSEGLKYLTHRFATDKPDYDKFINLCRKEFDHASLDYPNAADKLISRIREFAFSENPDWFIRKAGEKIFFKNGWSEPEFIEWYKNSNVHPASNVKWNDEMIIPFKNTIEVRAGSLLDIINEQIELAFGEEKNSFEFTINEADISLAEFYTDVDSFQNSLFHIFSMIRERAKKNARFRIKIEYENETLDSGDFKKIIITHVNSQATKNSNDPYFSKGDLNSIIKNLYGLCNYEIIGKFPDGYKKKILLTDDLMELDQFVKTHKAIPVSEDKVFGFSHVLKFY